MLPLNKKKKGIKRKIVLSICSTTLIVAALAITSGYYWAFYLLRNTVGQDHKEMAQLLASSIEEMIDAQMEQIRSVLTSVIVRNAIEVSNVGYHDLQKYAIKQMLLKRDQSWTRQGQENDIFEKYLETDAALRLRSFIVAGRDIAEIFVTDKYGGLVASSRKTSDYYQADEVWWQEAFNEGKGKLFIGHIEYDDSSKVWAIPFALPMRDQAGNLIGVCKVVVNIGSFFKPLEKFKIGKTGHAVLINEEGYIVFHREILPFARKFCHDEELQRLLKSKRCWQIVAKPHLHSEDTFIALAEIRSPFLIANNIKWFVLVDQNVKEIFAPLDVLVLQMVILTCALVVILVVMGFILGGVFVRPIDKLRRAAEHISEEGDLDYHVDIRTGDEIERLSDSFNKMTSELKKSTTSVANLNREIAERKKAEAKLVQTEKLAVLGKLAGLLSHELRNPLGVVKNAVFYLEETGANIDSKTRDTYLEIISKNTEKASKIVNDTLNFARPKRVFLSKNSISKIIDEVIQDVVVPERIKVERDYKDDKEINVDPLQLSQIFHNIIINSIQSIKDEGIIKIDIEHKENYIKVTITDSGQGIKEDDLSSIFEPLFTTKAKGIGLGLNVVKDIIERHHGSVEISSEWRKGTTVTIMFPIK